MRILLLLRGAPGCGKSTWIENNNLKPYTLSADDIRLLCQSAVMNVDGYESISQDNDTVVWKTLFTLLENRMQRGDFTVIDATNSKTVEMNRYKQLCKTYRYRIYCVDFTNIDIDEVKYRNSKRNKLKVVPEFVIDKMYARFKTQQIPSGITVIKPNELDKIWLKLFDFSEYKKIHHIGDIHGCYTVLKEYFDSVGGIKDDEFYIFTGDYIDRGLENVEVINFLLSIKDKKNVLMLEGNHERWLSDYGNDVIAKSKEFELVTKPQLIKADISKKDMRQLYCKFGQCAYYSYNDNEYLVTHAGLSTIPNNLSKVATQQMIKGVGLYNDFEKIAETWIKTTDKNCYQIHGHRNTKQLPIMVNDRVCNLEGRVEFGGCLRVVQLDKDGLHPIEIKNTVFKEIKDNSDNVVDSPIADIIISLRQSKFVNEKAFDKISVFNFTRNAFYDKVWNAQTIKARGLYIDTFKGKVFARSYDKFFNINEMGFTKLECLQDTLKFPVNLYVKENGFLGIVSYDEYNDDLFITTKSNPDSEHAMWFKTILYSTLSKNDINKLKRFLRDSNVSMVFECIDIENDPHIIKYDKSKVVLLDVIYNDINFKKFSDNESSIIANEFNLEYKDLACTVSNWPDFYDLYNHIIADDFEYCGNHIEGFVIEDSNGFMVKLKTNYYNFWKFMRSVVNETFKNGYIKKTSALTTAIANDFYGWVKLNRDTLINEPQKDIISLRDKFFDR